MITRKTKIVVASVVMGAYAGFLVIGVSAAPVEVQGPPTIEQHLTSINANMQLIKWMAGALIGMVGLVGSLVSYIFLSTVSNLKSSICHVEKKAESAIEKTDNIKREFLSIAAHDRICREKGT